jgi:hypothetical protein
MNKRLIAAVTLAAAALAPLATTSPANAHGPTWYIAGFQYAWYTSLEGVGHSNYVSNPAQPVDISAASPGGPIGNGAAVSQGDAYDQTVQSVDPVPHTFSHCTADCDSAEPKAIDPHFDVSLAPNDTQRVTLLPNKTWTPGVYEFFCKVHPWMRGSLRVSD